MSLNKVTLTGKVPGAYGGLVTFTPSNWLTDSTDSLIEPPAVVLVSPDRSGSFSVDLIATDNANLASGWYWTAVISVPGAGSESFSFHLAYANGASQDISGVATLTDPTPITTYMAVPTGTAASGDVPIATGSGSASAWGSLSGVCLATVVYAPSTETSKIASTTALAAFDTTNLTVSFTAPASGKVMIEVLAIVLTSAATAVWSIGLLDHTSSAVVGTVWNSKDGSANTQSPRPFKFYVTGLTPGQDYQYDLAGSSSAPATVTLACFGDTSNTPGASPDAVGGPVTIEVFGR